LRDHSEETITIKASAYRSDAHDFGLLATINCNRSDSNQEEELPSSNFKSRKGIVAWKKGQVIRLEKRDFPKKEWKGCEIEILVDVVDSGEYNIVA